VTKGDSNLSGPSITLRLERHFLSIVKMRGRGLALGKDLAVSSPCFDPYHGVRPSTLGLGLPLAFASGRFCSHLLAFARRLLAATHFTTRLAAKQECPDFPLKSALFI